MWLVIVIGLLLFSLAAHFLLWFVVMLGNSHLISRWRRITEFLIATFPALIAVGIIGWKLLS
jgi:hypothetical protein